MSEEATTQAPTENSLEVMQLQNARALERFQSPFESAAALRHYTQAASVFSRSQLVPKHLQGKVEDCLILMNMAMRMKEDPLLVLQNCFVVSGTPGFKTQFLIARANASGGLKSKIRWNVEKLSPEVLQADGYQIPNLRVTASAVDEFGELMESSVTSEMAVKEGWTKNPKYRSMPEHMLRWRAAAFLIRLYLPEVMMGMQSIEEIEDVAFSAPLQIEPAKGTVRLSELKRIEAPATTSAPTTFSGPEVTIEAPAQQLDQNQELPLEPWIEEQVSPEEAPQVAPPDEVDLRQEPISDEVKTTLREMLKGKNVTKALFAEYLDSNFGISNLAGLKNVDVQPVTKWITELPNK